MPFSLSDPVALPCGATLPNRLVKTAMSEGLADAEGHATPSLETLYRRWGHSGAGLIYTGNIQVDPDYLERPLNIVIHDESGRDALARLALAGTEGGAQFWAQLSHTGRQVDAAINPAPLAPSVVELDVLRGAGFNFAKPQAMNEAQIERAIGQFSFAARQVREAGFTGVTLHGAHGYLISQFLSPLTNKREDGWGGTPEKRARFLLTVIAAVRDAVGPDFPIGLKLNSSDFQVGGFTATDCVELVRHLNGTSLDLLELSGGSLEQPKMMGVTVKEVDKDNIHQTSTGREAYFIEFAREIRAAAQMPVMVVGGFRSRSAMVGALEHGDTDLIGLGRPLIAMPDGPRRLLCGEIDRLPSIETEMDIRQFMAWNNVQIERMGNGLAPDLLLTGEVALEAFRAFERRNMETLLSHRARKAA